MTTPELPREEACAAAARRRLQRLAGEVRDIIASVQRPPTAGWAYRPRVREARRALNRAIDAGADPARARVWLDRLDEVPVWDWCPHSGLRVDERMHPLPCDADEWAEWRAWLAEEGAF